MPITDDFNRANGPIGAGWETVLGTATPWIIDGNTAKPGAAQQLSITRRTEASFPGDHHAQCQSERTDNGVDDSSLGGVAVRIQANGDCYRARADGNFATLSRVVGGVSTFLADFPVAPIPNNTLYLIRLTATGSILAVRVNGVDAGTFDDAGPNLITGGKPGMAQIVGSSAIKARHESFESSDPVPQSSTRKRRRMLLDAKPVKVLADLAALNTLSDPFGLTDEIVVMVDFKTGVTAGVVRLESAPGANYAGTWKTEDEITFAGTAPLTLSNRVAPEGAVGRLRISTAISDGVIDAYIQRSVAR